MPSAQRAHCVVQFGAFEVHCCCLLVQYMGRGLDSLQHSVLHWIAKELSLDRKAREDCSNIKCHISGQPGPSTQIWKSKRGFHRPVLSSLDLKLSNWWQKCFRGPLLCIAVNWLYCCLWTIRWPAQCRLRGSVSFTVAALFMDVEFCIINDLRRCSYAYRTLDWVEATYISWPHKTSVTGVSKKWLKALSGVEWREWMTRRQCN